MARLIFTGLPAGEPIYGTFGQVAGYGYPHRGVDHGVDGAPIYSRSTRPARAVPFTNDGSFGIAVVLQHDHDGQALYEINAHMRRRLVKEGDTVQPGQLIGYVGATGKVTGSHDHWQICDSPAFPVDISHSFDPMAFIEEEDMSDLEDLINVVIGNGFDAVCRPGTEHLFPAGAVVTPEGQDGPEYRLTGRNAFEYGKLRGFSLALASQLLRKDLGAHIVGGHQ